MESEMTEWHDADVFVEERPSADFIRAVAQLLETDADDILSEMGYVPSESVVVQSQMAAA